MTEVLRYTAFTTDPSGGNPAGVVLDARGLDDTAMQAIAADLGYSETAFVTGEYQVRYFSPRRKSRSAATRPSPLRSRWQSGSGRVNSCSRPRPGRCRSLWTKGCGPP